MVKKRKVSHVWVDHILLEEIVMFFHDFSDVRHVWFVNFLLVELVL